jgi:uncharacterized protein (TIGR03437 family)
MDAAQTNIKKIVLFLATALWLMTPVHGYAQPVLATTTTAVSIGSSACNDFQNILLTSSGAAIPFTVHVNYPNGTNPSAGDAYGNWLYSTILGSGTTSTGATFSSTTGASGVSLQVGLNDSIGAVTDSAQVVITPTNLPASAPVTITVYYAQNTSCGGNTGSSTNGYITITPGNLAITAGLGAQQSQTATIQNLTSESMTFTYFVSGGTWISASANSTTISPSGTAPVNVTGDASKVSATGTYDGILTITPQSGFGTALNIPVTFVVTASGGGGGGSTGTLTLNGASSNTYNTTFSFVEPNAPGGQCVPIQDTAAGANSYYFQVTTTGGGNWLFANYNTSGTINGSLAPGADACVNLTLSNVANSLPSGAYQGSVALTSSSGATASISLTLYVSAGSAPGITVVPGLIYAFPNVAVASTTLQQEQFTITAATGYILGTASATSPPGWFNMSTPTANGSSEFFTVTANPTGLTAGVYSTTVTMNSSGAIGGTTTILIVLPVGQAGATTGTGGGGTSLVAPTSLAFQQQLGTSFWTGLQEAQTITITGQPGTQWSAGIIYGTGGANWLNFDSPQGGTGTFGSGPASLVVDLFNGVGSLAASTTPYTATIDITTTGGNFSVGVTVLVTAGNVPVLLGKPALTTFSVSSGGSAISQTITVVGSDNTGSTSSPPISAGASAASWLTATTSGNTMDITANPSGLSTGVYSGTIPVTASTYANAINYPVVLIVNGGGGGTSTGPLTLSTSSLNFTNVTAQSQQTLNVSAGSTTSVTAFTSLQSCAGANWLGIAPSGALTVGTANTAITVTVTPTGISNGTTCEGAISLQTADATQTVSVSMTVGTSIIGGNITVSPLSMTFAYTQGQTVPAAQTATIVNAVSGTAVTPFTVTTSPAGTWLSASPTSGSTPLTSPGLSVSVAPGSLAAGPYTGTVTISPTGGTAQVINVTLTVTAVPVVTATPTTLSLTYLVGGTSPTGTIQVSGGGSAAAFTASASGSAVFQVSPTSGTTPNSGTFNLTVSLVPAVLATLVPGPYTGTITVAGTSPATGTTIVNVTLNVTAPLPTITGVTNAASGASGAISPGEIVSIYAPTANPIGPTPLVQLNSTTCPSPCTQVPATMGGVTVTFLPLGVQAPLIFVSAGQINAVVPYQVATAGASQSVEVKYLGQTSNAFPVTVATTAPGIFTSNLSGTGPAAVGQYSPAGAYTINSASAQALPGYILVIYLTGEGVVIPAATSGSVTQVSSTLPLTPQPVSAPTVFIDNQPTTLTFYGEAPGFVSGLLQINVLVPTTTHTGAVSLSVTLGSASSQAGVTVYVQ